MASPLHVVSDDFKDAGKEPGLQIWRIEEIKVAPVPIEQYGKFFNGDSYIILQTRLFRETKLVYDIFFWLGRESSIDEITTAAYKTAELGDSLNGYAPHHREIEGHESQEFLSLFRDGFQVLEGGIDSGFRKVDRDAYEVVLYHLKGSRNVRMTRVELSAKSLNHGDAFVLDAGPIIYLWNGHESSKNERAKGIDVCQKLRNNEKKGNAEIIALEDGQTDRGSEAEEFWKLLNGTPEDVLSAEAAGSDTEHEQKKDSETRLHLIENKALTLVAQYPLERSMLKTESVFLIETTDMVYVWLGRKADPQAKKEAIVAAQINLEPLKKSIHTPILRVVEGAETSVFKDNFKLWDPIRLPGGPVKAEIGDNVSKPLEQKDISISLTRRSIQEPTIVPDAGSKQVNVYRINNFNLEQIPSDRMGVFFAGDSYVVTYEYRTKNVPRSIIFMWQGRNSTIDETGGSAFRAREVSQKMNKPTHVRIVQGKETPDFLALFDGAFVVRKGGVPSGWNTVQSAMSGIGGTPETEEQMSQTSLFQVKGYSKADTRAYEVEATCSRLNSGDTFVLLTPTKAFVWYGSGSNPGERICGNEIAKKLVGERELVMLEEGSEEEEFFEALGGKTEYTGLSDVEEEEIPEPRLFHFTNRLGVNECDEIFNFCQDDLNGDDCMILDAFDAVYVWYGIKCEPEEREGSLKLAKEYIEKKPDGREDTPISEIEQGQEPPSFIQHFPGWDPAPVEKFIDPYQLRLERLKAEREAASGSQTILNRPQLRSTPRKPEEPASAPPTRPAQPPPKPPSQPAPKPAAAPPKPTPAGEIPERSDDPSKKETLLSDEEFQNTFKMDREAFYKLPAWKQKDLKQKNGLF